jgi:XTP/dITP diphosphohydrolase
LKLIVATKNAGKIREFKEILKDLGCEIVPMTECGINVDVVEDADTFLGNAIKKATEIMKLTGEITIADDSGLMVDALMGAPGVYSARYAGEHATDLENNIKLLDQMKDIAIRSARFVCTIAVAFPNGKIETAYGEMEGLIDYEMKGSGGFGYDVLFYLPEHKKTSAEIPSDVKNKISHRYKALCKLKEILRRNALIC